MTEEQAATLIFTQYPHAVKIKKPKSLQWYTTYEITGNYYLLLDESRLH